MEKKIIVPDGLSKPVGFNHAIAVSGGTIIYLAGQTATNASGDYVSQGDIVGQFKQALANLQIAVEASGGQMTDIVKLNLYVTDVSRYKANLRQISEAYRTFFGKYFPVMTLVGVTELFDPAAMIEIEGVAVTSSPD